MLLPGQEQKPRKHVATKKLLFSELSVISAVLSPLLNKLYVTVISVNFHLFPLCSISAVLNTMDRSTLPLQSFNSKDTSAIIVSLSDLRTAHQKA